LTKKLKENINRRLKLVTVKWRENWIDLNAQKEFELLEQAIEFIKFLRRSVPESTNIKLEFGDNYNGRELE
jgi:hypothetical protein